MPIRKLCSYPRCPNLQPCALHSQRHRDTKTSDERRFYGSQRWRLTSERHRRDEPLCRECGKKGVLTVASMTDHIVQISQGGDQWDEANLQSLCNPCHNIKRQSEVGNPIAARWLMARVTVVVGLPASGKTTYVREHMQRGDLVVDMDALFSALSFLEWYDKPDELLPFVASARDAVISRLKTPSGIHQAWIITTDRNAADSLRRTLGAELVFLDVPEQERQRRLSCRC